MSDGTTHVFSRGELLEVPHGRLHLVLVVADRRGGSAGDAARTAAHHAAIAAPATPFGSGVGRHRLFLKRLFFIAVNGELYLPLRLSIWELSGNYLRVQTCRRDRLTGLSAHH